MTGKQKRMVALSKLKGVTSVDTVTGLYDVVAVVRGETSNMIGDIVTEKIHLVADISMQNSDLPDKLDLVFEYLVSSL